MQRVYRRDAASSSACSLRRRNVRDAVLSARNTYQFSTHTVFSFPAEPAKSDLSTVHRAWQIIIASGCTAVFRRCPWFLWFMTWTPCCRRRVAILHTITVFHAWRSCCWCGGLSFDSASPAPSSSTERHLVERNRGQSIELNSNQAFLRNAVRTYSNHGKHDTTILFRYAHGSFRHPSLLCGCEMSLSKNSMCGQT